MFLYFGYVYGHRPPCEHDDLIAQVDRQQNVCAVARPERVPDDDDQGASQAASPLATNNRMAYPEGRMVELEEDNQESAYLCGRLLYWLENAQRAVVPGIRSQSAITQDSATSEGSCGRCVPEASGVCA